MAGKKPKNDATKARSPRTGKRFNRQGKRIHGPKPKRETYALAIEKVLCSNWAKHPLTSKEIAYHANEHISKHWTQLNGYSVGAIMRKYEKDGLVNKQTRYEGKVRMTTWHRNWDIPLESDYEYRGGNWKGNPRVNYKDPLTGKWRRVVASDENLKKISKIKSGG